MITWLYISPNDRGESTATPARRRPVPPAPTTGAASWTPTTNVDAWKGAETSATAEPREVAHV